MELSNNLTHTILIIDDDPNNIAILSDYFIDTKYTILVAEDSDSGIFRAEYTRPDIILMDVMLPGVDGYETCRRIKQNEKTKDIPIIFMSSLTEIENKIKAFTTGAVDYVTKPFQKEEVLARVNVHLRIKKLTNELQVYNNLLEKMVEERTEELSKTNEELIEEIKMRSETEAALKKSHEQLEVTLDALPDFLFETDYEGRILNYHASNTDLLYASPESFLNKKIGDVLPEDAAKICNEAMSLAIKNGYHSGSIYSLNLPYGLRSYELSISVGKIGGDLNNRLVILARDITERIKADAEIKNLHKLLLNIINSMPSMIIGIDKSARITHFNQLAGEVSSFSLKDTAYKNIFDAFPFLIKYENRLKSVIEKNSSSQILKEKIKDDSKYYNIYFFPMDYNNNKYNGVVIRIDDVTNMVLQEDQLRQSQKMEIMGILAGGIAHDFNNILGALIGATCLIQLKIESDSNARELISEDLNMINISIDRAKKLVGNLLTLSKKKEAYIGVFDLKDSIKNINIICKNTFDKSVEIKYNYCSGKSAIVGDQGQIEQALLNLCINAMHSMTIMRKENEKRGGVLSISVEKFIPNDDFLYKNLIVKDTDYLAIKVEDTGVGMEKKILEKIFDPLFTTKGKDKGTGLGLAMVQNIINDHKGFVEVYSEPGVGSTFLLILPEYKENEISQKEEKLDQDYPKGSGTVLVVDDDKSVNFVTRNMLELLGYTVLLAESGEEGIKIFEEKNKDIDLVLIDMIMPKMSGKEVFDKLIQISPKVKVILTSGFQMDDRITDTLKKGALDFIYKPYSIKELAIKVKEYISG